MQKIKQAKEKDQKRQIEETKRNHELMLQKKNIQDRDAFEKEF